MAYKTPGVYIEEISKFPPSIAEVATAVPAFIGYTERADRDGEVLINVPTKVVSMLEYQQLFGGAQPIDTVNVELEGKDKQYAVTNVSLAQRFYMYEALRLFFDNGGGKCYIISVGKYTDGIAINALRSGLEALARYDEPTIILFPDAVALSTPELSTLQQLALTQCARLQDRVAVFDVKEHDQCTTQSRIRWQPAIDEFRQGIGINDLKYGAAYTPWLRTTYPREVPFSVFAKSTTNRDGTALEHLMADDKLNGLVTAMQRALSDVKVVDDKVSSLLVDGQPTLKDSEAALRRAVANAKSGEVNTACKTYIEFVRRVLVGVTDWAQAGTLQGDGLKSELAGYAKKHLGKVAREIIALEKHAAVRTVTGFAAPSASAVAQPVATSPASDTEDADPDAETSSENTGTGTSPATDPGTPAAVPSDPVNDAYRAFDGIHWLVDASTTDITVASILAWAPASGITVTVETIVDELDARVSGTPSLMAFISEVQRAAKTWAKLAQDVLYKQHTIISNIVQSIQRELAIVPPSGAIAGVYAKVDGSRGVWKAPANVSLAAVLEPVEFIDFFEQEDLNVDVTAGKSINAIRPFTGMGTLVWGARTLAGNDNEWRYVSVRRFFNMVEESVKKSTAWAVFEPNDPNLWTKVKSMIDNYLVQKWRDGALAGPTPDKAFFVKVGLGQTMTAVDILEGRMNIEIGMAVVRPAEFIVLKFSHKMQEA